MECRELVTQVLGEAGKPGSGWRGNPEVRNCRKLLPFLGWKDGKKSWMTLRKLELPLACPSGGPAAEAPGGREEGKYRPLTTSSLLPVPATGQAPPEAGAQGASKQSLLHHGAGSGQGVRPRGQAQI